MLGVELVLADSRPDGKNGGTDYFVRGGRDDESNAFLRSRSSRPTTPRA